MTEDQPLTKGDLSYDVKAAYGFALMGGLLPNEELNDQEQMFFKQFSKIINLERVHSLEKFRFVLRYFVSNYPEENITESKLLDIPALLYREYGSFSGDIEHEIYFEDWIGFRQ